jgi:tetratricopeptide (TPR) repeat protein
MKNATSPNVALINGRATTAYAYGIAANAKAQAPALAPISQHDQRVWRMYLDGLVDAQQWAEAVNVGESAVLLDVGSALTHADYATALAAQGDHERAIFEGESSLLCAGIKPKEAAAAHAAMAKAYLALKKLPDARQHRDEALKLDPDSDAKQLQIP